MRCICWPEQFVIYEELIKPDAIVVVRGAVDKRPGSEEANLIVNEIIPLADLEARYTRGVMIRVDEAHHGPQKLEQLYEILRGYPGKSELQLTICLADGRKVACKCSDMSLTINPEMRTRSRRPPRPRQFSPNNRHAGGWGAEWEWAGKKISFRGCVAGDTPCAVR